MALLSFPFQPLLNHKLSRLLPPLIDQSKKSQTPFLHNSCIRSLQSGPKRGLALGKATKCRSTAEFRDMSLLGVGSGSRFRLKVEECCRDWSFFFYVSILGIWVYSWIMLKDTILNFTDVSGRFEQLQGKELSLWILKLNIRMSFLGRLWFYRKFSLSLYWFETIDSDFVVESINFKSC